MTPTPKLRFVERQIPLSSFYIDPRTMKPSHQTIQVLQQWWEHGISGWNAPGEWRDVPLEEEA
jgi:hypothetical protein